uniref:hypothetical protein n=1 Tax=uncultured Acidovorax sp. TaxID=158751 RepID=UPI0025E599A3|nr:hypothetical protein [uncultured Acidovorax sp.]
MAVGITVIAAATALATEAVALLLDGEKTTLSHAQVAGRRTRQGPVSASSAEHP